MTFFEWIKRGAIPFLKGLKNEKTHHHDFLDKLEGQIASWSKRNCPGDAVYFRGTLRQCPSCGEYRFRVPGLREVEVTR